MNESEGQAARHDHELVLMVAGMLSTIDFRPAELHPERMIPRAEQVIDHVRRWENSQMADASVRAEPHS